MSIKQLSEPKNVHQNEVENIYATLWEIYLGQCLPNFIGIGWVL